MHHHHNKLATIIFCLSLSISFTTKACKTEDSLVLVKSGNSCGTGVLCEMDDAIYIITNVHILESPDKYTFISELVIAAILFYL